MTRALRKGRERKRKGREWNIYPPFRRVGHAWRKIHSNFALRH
jgi:hypothetical protein